MDVVPFSSSSPEPLPSAVRERMLASTQTGTPPMASAMETTPAKSIIMKWSIRIPVSSYQVATVHPGPPRPRLSLVCTSRVLAG